MIFSSIPFAVLLNCEQLLYVSMYIFLALLMGPFIQLFFAWFSSLYLWLYKITHLRQHEQAKQSPETLRGFWHDPLTFVAKCWLIPARYWHGHEIVGLENVPLDEDNKAALFILYHAALPVDFVYVFCDILTRYKKLIRVVIDRTVFRFVGLSTLMEATEATPGTIHECVDMLKRGQMLCISPGGVREGLFGDNSYEIIWENRKGFAKIAHGAQVQMIPVFTQNSREIFKSFKLGHGFFRRFYLRTRMGYSPNLGWFPVKLRTFIGKPISYEEFKDLNIDETVDLARARLDSLIKTNQSIPGSILRGMKERFLSSEDINSNEQKKH